MNSHRLDGRGMPRSPRYLFCQKHRERRFVRLDDSEIDLHLRPRLSGSEIDKQLEFTNISVEKIE